MLNAGWLTVTGWQAGIASTAYISGTLVQGLIELVDPTYEPRLWQGTLLFYVVLLLSVFIDAVLGPALLGVETAMSVLYTLGFFGILVPLVYLAQHSSAQEVFTTSLNDGNWPSQGLSVFVGLSGYAFAFLGTVNCRTLETCGPCTGVRNTFKSDCLTTDYKAAGTATTKIYT